jgi:hypothetical protein
VSFLLKFCSFCGLYSKVLFGTVQGT